MPIWKPPAKDAWVPPQGDALEAQSEEPSVASADNWFTQKFPVGGGLMAGLPNGSWKPSLSLEKLAEFLPGLGGTVGAAVGNVPGAAILGGGGEALRQLLRRSAKVPQATGMGQRLMGLDPNSPLAAAVGIGLEGFGAGTVEKAMNLAKVLLPKLRPAAARVYAQAFPEEGIKTRAEFAKTIEPIIEDLPGPSKWGTRSKIHEVAKKQIQEVTGPAVGKAYKSDIPSTYEPAIKALRARAHEEQAVPGFFETATDQAGVTKKVFRKPVEYDPEIAKAFRGRASETQIARDRKAAIAIEHGGREPEPTIYDVFRRRTAASDRASRQSSGTFTKISKGLDPKRQALKKERDLYSEILHTPRGEWTKEMAEAGKLADSIHSAWKTVEVGTTKEGGSGAVPVVRWALTRAISGTPGIAAAGTVGLSKPAFWTSMTAKKLLQLRRLIEVGDNTGAEQLIRTALDAFNNQPEQEEP